MYELKFGIVIWLRHRIASPGCSEDQQRLPADLLVRYHNPHIAGLVQPESHDSSTRAKAARLIATAAAFSAQ
jgi:hypothetical protein